MLCVVPASNVTFQKPVEAIESLPLNEILKGMVTCHSLTKIDGQLVGDPLDLKMFESTGWELIEPDVSDNAKFLMLFPTELRPPPGFKHSNMDESLVGPQKNSMDSDTSENLTDGKHSLSEG